jgi:enamine deaminase RidA (YjgF/YER057c/UK114 family)
VAHLCRVVPHWWNPVAHGHQQHPDVVRRFVRARVRGWVDYLTGDPSPANARLQKPRPALPADFMVYSIGAMKDYHLVLGDPARGERMGLLTHARLQKLIDLLREVGVLDKAAAGSLDAVQRVVFVSGFVNAVSGFADSPTVINGASDLFVQVFGDAGRHARAAIAVAGLPRDSTVEVQVVVKLKK